ncbi:MAG TPA: cytochrome c nitrite reductase small subunit [Bacteroidales bacterium]|nr:cytochrome c nitrite reductase small subunit [Bacteroidales bacterium]
MIKLLQRLVPPDQWKLPVLLLAGILVGIFSYAFYVSRAASYLSDNPQTCVNCHVMAPQFATWNHSAHRNVASCNDCHVPHNNVFNHYFFKAKDGLRHATIFTLRNEPQVIHIKEAGIEVVQNNCIRCHGELFNPQKQLTGKFEHPQDRLCWECHRETPHGRVNSLSSAPAARVPLPQSPVPDWIKSYSKSKK